MSTQKNIAEDLVKSLKRRNSKLRNFGLLGDDAILVDMEVFTTSSIILDRMINYGGIPRARITHIYGPERAFKTTVALRTMLHALKKHPTGFAVFADLERNYDAIQSRQHLYYLGFTDDELNRIVYLRDVPEHCFNVIEELVREPDCLMALVDSIGGMISVNAYEKKYEENQKMGQQPLMISEILKRLNQANNNAAIVFINQARDVMGGRPGYGGPQYTYSGGRTLRHLIHLSLDMSAYHMKSSKEREDANDQAKITVRIDKCKLGGENARFSLNYNLADGRFDEGYEVFFLAYQNNLLYNSGAWYYMGNKEENEVLFKACGGDAFEQGIKSDPELYAELKRRVLATLSVPKVINWTEHERDYDAMADSDAVEDEVVHAE